MLLWALIGCGEDPVLVAERDQLQEEVERLTSRNERLEREADTLHAKTLQMAGELKRAHKREAHYRLGLTDGQTLSAQLVTSRGTITCALWPDAAPMTVLNFVELAEGSRAWTDPVTNEETRRPLYDGTIFHRVIPEFMIQGGDPLGNGMGGPGYQFADEIDPMRTFNQHGLLAMANSGPDTNGSQFFITDRATPASLNGKHTIFGLCEDLDVVEDIATVSRGDADRPNKDVVLERVVIRRQ